MIDHPSGLHDFESLSDAGFKQLDLINQAVNDSKQKANDIRVVIKNLDHSSQKLQVQFHKAQNEVNDTFLFYRSMLDERKQELLKELESVFSAKQLSLNVVGQKAQETVDKIYQTCEFIDRLMKYATVTECLLFKKLLDSKLQSLMSYSPEINLQNASDLEFLSNYQAIQVGVRNTFGYVRSSGEVNGPAKQPPIARPSINSSSSSSSVSSAAASAFMMTSNGNVNGFTSNGNGLLSSQTTVLNGHGAGHHHHNNNNSSGSNNNSFMFNGSSLNVLLESNKQSYVNGLDGGSNNHSMQNGYESILSKRFPTNNSGSGLGPFSSSINDIGLNGNVNGLGGGGATIGTYEKWSNGGGDIFQNGNDFSLNISNGDVLDLTSKLLSTSIFPPKSQIKRQKMIYHCKFGEFGALEGQFTEPSGVAVNAQNDIIVADTNNHRIQIFDKEGRFRFQFGECGKRDGQLLYPNRVAVVKHTGDIIVTERSPTHQIQIYNQYGQFLRKFGATILQHPRGITVDNKGRIVVVECKVMRVIIFDQMGSVLQKFGCSKHLEFPNGVVVNDHQEIFISDNRAHCVKVFNYDGVFLRQIGNEGITNYPIGVGINATGEILIADNHNNFNLTIFTQEGQLVSALESKVKHAQCFDVALMDDGSVVLASKDYRLYIYRYVQIPPIGL
jgi:tripartite motif-containing protein 2/3